MMWEHSNRRYHLNRLLHWHLLRHYCHRHHQMYKQIMCSLIVVLLKIF
ncbi:hypothetical protein EPA86_01960 [Litorilituus lipolyticus]|uniref:Uncharacterized protein n=1 Tax=Litorilituus lipolyticus TaxID=2491017 RepID=A0A502L495_9GAMM|nr:hypothetical protein EPA86_01960 [Litorilituus lipolyticus]